jgi:hypothetical protein
MPRLWRAERVEEKESEKNLLSLRRCLRRMSFRLSGNCSSRKGQGAGISLLTPVF